MINDNAQEILSPKECTDTILELSGAQYEPDVASDLWSDIIPHKWLLSEKVGRDVGLRTACIDFLENMEQAPDEYITYKQTNVLSDMGAQAVSREMWDTISDSQPPKQLVKCRIILPLTEEDLSKKHGVILPKAILFFGPPGTGKTHFAKAIAGILSWIYYAGNSIMRSSGDRGYK